MDNVDFRMSKSAIKTRLFEYKNTKELSVTKFRYGIGV